MKHKIISSAFALLIVTSVFVMPMNQVGMVGTASASHDCDTTDAAVAAITFTYVNKDKCLNNHVAHAVEEVRDIEKNKTAKDLYSASLSQEANSEVMGATYDNYLQDTETVAWSKAEVAIAEAYEEGKNKSQAKEAAHNRVDNYYTPKQINLIESWNSDALAFDYVFSRQMQEGFDQGRITELMIQDDDPIYGYTYEGESYHDMYQYCDGACNQDRYGHSQMGNKSLTLLNGSTKTVEMIGAFNGDGHAVYASVEKGNVTVSNQVEARGVYAQEGANDSTNMVQVIDFGEYAARWDKIETQRNSLHNETDTYVDTIWADLEAGNIDSTDIISRNTLMFEYGTKTTSDNGTYYDAIGAAAGMGLDTPDLNGTGQMQVTIADTGNTYDGLVFARNAPNGTWEIGTTYDPDSIEGPVMLATTDGNLTEISSEFTIDSAVNKEGEEQTTVETTEYNYQTANTSELSAKYDRLLELTQELENRSQSVATGGSGTDSTDSDPKIPDWLTEKYGGIPLYGIIVIGLALAYVVASVKKD